MSGDQILVRVERRVHNLKQITLYNPLKDSGYIPEEGSEIFATKLPEQVTEMDLVKFFTGVGEIFQIRLVLNTDWIENRGYCFVTYMNSQTAKQAVHKLDESRKMKITICVFPAIQKKENLLSELKTKGLRKVVDAILSRSTISRMNHSRSSSVSSFSSDQSKSSASSTTSSSSRGFSETFSNSTEELEIILCDRSVTSYRDALLRREILRFGADASLLCNLGKSRIHEIQPTSVHHIQLSPRIYISPESPRIACESELGQFPFAAPSEDYMNKYNRYFLPPPPGF